MVVYVDPLYGSHVNAGTSETSPKRSIYDAVGVTPNQTAILLPGVYDYDAEFQATYSNTTFIGIGDVKIVSTNGSSSISVTRCRFKNIKFYGFQTLFSVTSAVSSGLILEDVTAYTTRPSAIFAAISGPSDPRIYLKNCTINGFSTVLTGTNGFLTSMLNCIVDDFSTMLGGSVIYDVGFPTPPSDYNAFDGNAEPHGIDLTGVLRTSIYTDMTALPYPDLSLKKGGSPSSLVGAGIRGDDIGAPDAYVYENITIEKQVPWAAGGFSETAFGNPKAPQTDWTGWDNDDLWYPVGGPAGSDAISAGEGSTASPAILAGAPTAVSVEPRGWIIDPSDGGGLTARVISPVFDYGADALQDSPTLEGVSWWGEENSSLGSGSNHIFHSGTSGTPTIEYRAKNSSFLATASATGDIEWTAITKSDRPHILRRYFQFRIMLRRNGS